MVAHPLFSIVASKKRLRLSFLKAVLSLEKRDYSLFIFFSSEKTWLPPFMYYANNVIAF